jgi:hypothetical protein
MVTLAIPAVVLLAVAAIGLYFWQKPPEPGDDKPAPPPPVGLFAAENAAALEQEEKEAQQQAEATRRAELRARAENGEKSALEDAHGMSDRALYDEVLGLLVENADSESNLLSLASYVTQREFPVNRRLAEAVIESWRRAADRHSTAKALHFAALNDDAKLYQSTVEAAFAVWRAGKLPDTSAAELRALFDGEYWILSSKVRSSGAGFLLKRTLAGARRELEAVARASE